MKNRITFLILCLVLCNCKQEQLAKTNNQTDTDLGKKPFVIGETVSLFSKTLEEKRTFNIYLPNSYNETSNQKYPVIYLLDGSADEDFIHVSGVVQFGSFSWVNMLPETIVVGVSNVDRKRDFTYPSNNELDKKEFPTHGGSKKFIQFLETELQPFIDRHYKTTSKKTLIGQSLGGLLATEIVFTKPELFDDYIIISPSLWWDDGALLKQEMQPFDKPKSIYIGVGKEGEVMEQVANLLYDKISADKKESKVLFHFLEEQNHGDALHLAVYDAFKKMNTKDRNNNY